MKKFDLSDYVAASMNSITASKEHQSLFGLKTASEEEVKEDENQVNDENDAKSDSEKSLDADCSYADDKEEEAKVSEALNIALDGLLKASAALDYAGFGKGSAGVLKLAALVVEAKKAPSKDKEKAKKEKEKAKADKAKAKEKEDMNKAKAKAKADKEKEKEKADKEKAKAKADKEKADKKFPFKKK